VPSAGLSGSGTRGYPFLRSLDGRRPAEVTDSGLAAASEREVRDFAGLLMMGGDRGRLRRFSDGDEFIQHPS